MSTRSLLIKSGLIKPATMQRSKGVASPRSIEARRHEFKTDMQLKTDRALKILRLSMH